MGKSRPVKKRQKARPAQPQLPGMPPPTPPGTIRILPMQLQIGDRMTDSTRRVGGDRAALHNPRARRSGRRATGRQMAGEASEAVARLARSPRLLGGRVDAW